MRTQLFVTWSALHQSEASIECVNNHLSSWQRNNTLYIYKDTMDYTDLWPIAPHTLLLYIIKQSLPAKHNENPLIISKILRIL